MGEQYTPVLELPFTADGGVTRRRFVGFDGAQIDGAGEKAFGVARFDVSDGKVGTVIVIGTAVVEAGGQIAKGVAVTSDADGKAVAAAALSVVLAAGSDTTDKDGAHAFAGGVLPQAVNGYAREAASGAGAFVEILLTP